LWQGRRRECRGGWSGGGGEGNGGEGGRGRGGGKGRVHATATSAGYALFKLNEAAAALACLEHRRVSGIRGWHFWWSTGVLLGPF